MIKKWKVTPVSNRPRQDPLEGRRSRDDSSAPISSALKVEKAPRKPRRNTTGGSKQTIEDIQRAKELAAAMNDDIIYNELDQEIDPNSTLGRKQLISMLKKRYGPEIDAFRSSGEVSEKEKVRRDRQRERDKRHEQRMIQESREMQHHNGVHHAPAMSLNRNLNYRPSLNSHGGSDDSEDLSQSSSPIAKRNVHTSNVTLNSTRRTSSDDEIRHDNRFHVPIQNGFSSPQKPKEVVFLQYRDEVKRVNLPSSISSIDTLKALFVSAFPGRVAMPHFEEGSKSLYVKDMETGVYYQLEDISEVVNRSFLKIQEIDTISDSQSEASAYKFRTQTLPNHHGHQQRNYAESLQDFNLSAPRLRRQNSDSSLRSDNVLTRPTYNQNNENPYSYIEDGHATVQQHSSEVRSNQIEKSTSNSALKQKPQANDLKSTTVQDQLEDLSELLRTALNEEDHYHASVLHEVVDIKNPGKINQNLIDNLQNATENNARKKSLPKHFQPTAIVMAQQESDRRTPSEERNDRLPPQPEHKIKSSTSVKVTVNSRSNINGHNQYTPMKRTDEQYISAGDTLTTQNIGVEEGHISPAHRYKYEERVNDIVKPQNFKTKTVEQPVASTQRNITGQFARAQSSNTADQCISRKQESTVEQSLQRPTDININSNVKINTEKKEAIQENDCSTQLADELLSQLLELEEEVKAQTSSVSSSRSSSFRNRRGSGVSNGSKSSVTFSNMTTSIPNKTSETIDEEQRARGISVTVPYTQQPYPAYQQKSRSNTDALDSNNAPLYATIQKELQTNSHTITTFDNTDGDVFVTTPTKHKTFTTPVTPTTAGVICQKSSVTTPDFFELEDSASLVRKKLKEMRKDLKDLRRCHVDNTRSFKADLQKKLLEFRKKAARVDENLQQKLDLNNNFIFANEHPVRERRHRLTADQIEYGKKMDDTQQKLLSLEGNMEMLRIDVVTKKRVDRPKDLDDIHEELTSLTKSLAEIKNRYHGLHDMLKVVMTSEMEIIEKEKKFVVDEPEKLEKLITRCKSLSGTLFTLQKLASVQNVSPVSPNKKQSFQYPGQSYKR